MLRFVRASAAKSSIRGVRGLLLIGVAAYLAALSGCAPPATETPQRQPLRLALHGDPSSFDPHLQSEVIAQSILGNVYQSLVSFDSDLRLVPVLAERWENPDDLTWRFDLRGDVTFHDGRPFTSADVIFSLDRARSHPASKSAVVAIEAVRAIDEHSVEIRTATPYPILLNKLAFLYIVPAGAPAEIRQPMGTGPYRFTPYDGGERLRLEAFAEHWRGPPPEPVVEFYFVSDPGERLERLLQGEFDFADEPAPEDVPVLDAHADFRVESRSSLTVAYLQMRLDAAPFDNPRVRQAIDEALDREALVRDILRGQGQPVAQMVSPNVFGFVPDLPPVSQDLAAARRWLDEAGGGFEAVLEVREGRDVEPIRSQLLAAGIHLEVVERPWSEMYPRLQAGEVPFYFGSWVCTEGDASDLLDRKVHTRNLERGYGSSNSNRYSNPALDKLIEDSGRRLDMVQRLEILQRALRLLSEDRAFIPLFTPYELYAVRKEIVWTPRQDGQIYAYEMRR